MKNCFGLEKTAVPGLAGKRTEDMESEREFLEEFVTEAKEHLDTIEDDFLSLEKQKNDPDRPLVDKVFRSIHSIKGASGFLGLYKIGDLAHVMETLLSMIRAGKIRPESEFIDALLAGADLLATMLDDINNSNDMDITKVHDRLSSMLAKELSPKIKDELNTAVKLSGYEGDDIGFDISEFTLKNIPSNMSLYVLKYDLTELAGNEHKSPVVLIRELLSTGEILDARLHISSNDLHAGLPRDPLMYEVLYATILFPDDIQEVTGLPDDRVIHVKENRVWEDIVSEAKKEANQKSPPPMQEPENPLPPNPPLKAINAMLNDINLQIKSNAPPPKDKIASPEPPHALPLKVRKARPEPKSEPPPVTRPEPSDACTPVQEKDSGDSGPGISSTIRIHVDILDKLMMLAGELVLVRNQQLLSVGSDDPVARSISQRLDIVTTELQETIMRSRMQPIGKIFRKFPRIIRELGKANGKEIQISISGNNVELDKTILEYLADPLTHLIRNCCDHGIETPEQRLRKGKPEEGQIRLSAWHEAGHINIEIQDDGKGIDPEIIRKKVLEKGLKKNKELERLSHRETLRLILLPGFSTASQVSSLSGRGVGMDVVKTGVEKLGGSLEIESSVDQGSTIHLRLPLTLAIIPCLVVVASGERYAIPQINLVELVCLYDEDASTKIECADKQEVYRLRDRLLPMVRLSEVLARPTPFTLETKAEISEQYRNQETSEEGLHFAVLKVGKSRFGLIIDLVLGTEDIVVKPMHPAMKSLSIYSGATIMGDGKAALILDIDGIAEHAGILVEGRTDDRQIGPDKNDDELQTVLLFEYGEKERFAMALPLIRRVEHVSISEIEEVGDKEFITINGISVRILRLDQVLDVSPGVPRDDMFLIIPRYIKRPMGLLASKLVDIQETAAELNLESYMEDGLLGTSIVHGHMTLFIDIYRLIEKVEPEWFADRRLGQFGKPGLPPEVEKRVLLVEDASFFRQLIKGYLEADGYKVTTAENGQVGLDQLHEQEFDLIVSDIEMPVLDGWEFMKRVRNEMGLKQLPTVALTALDADSDREKAMKCGYDRYEVKIDRERFLTAIAELMDSQRPGKD